LCNYGGIKYISHIISFLLKRSTIGAIYLLPRVLGQYQRDKKIYPLMGCLVEKKEVWIDHIQTMKDMHEGIQLV
jgi:hypothetical protein